MKKITLLQAFAILQSAAAVIIDNIVIYPSLDEIRDSDENEFLFLGWEYEDQEYSAKFCEGDNQVAQIKGNILILIDDEGEETELSILIDADLENKNQKLIDFAAVCLQRLEMDEEWDADTADMMGNAAIEMGLATVDEETKLFKLI